MTSEEMYTRLEEMAKDESKVDQEQLLRVLDEINSKIVKEVEKNKKEKDEYLPPPDLLFWLASQLVTLRWAGYEIALRRVEE